MSAQEILVIRFGSLGDVVLTFPALALLGERFPAARIVVATKAAYAPLAAAHPAVDEVMTISPGDSGLLATLGLGWRVRRRCFAAVYDLHGSLRSRVVTALSGSPLRKRVGSRACDRRLLVLGAHWRRLTGGASPPPPEPAWPAAALAAARTIDPHHPPSALAFPDLALAAAVDRRPGSAPLGVAVCPGARHATKCWPHFRELAADLIARGNRVTVVLGPDDPWEAVEGAEVVRGPLLELARTLARSDVAVGNDSGLTHVASAVGTPVVVLSGPTVPALGFLPVGHHRVVERHDLNCRPCAVHGGRSCPRRDHACLAGVAPARVIAEIDELIAASTDQEMVHAR